MINVYFCFIYLLCSFCFTNKKVNIREARYEVVYKSNSVKMNVENNVIFMAFLVHDKLYIPWKWSWPERGTFASFAGNVLEVPRENSVRIAFVRAEIRLVLCQMWGVPASLTWSINLAWAFQNRKNYFWYCITVNDCSFCCLFLLSPLFALFPCQIIFLIHCIFTFTLLYFVGRDRLVVIATRYGLNGRGIESGWWQGFAPVFRAALVCTQPPAQWVPGLFPGDEADGAWCWSPTSI